MDICMIGTGYVGLVTGAVLAELGNNVICADTDTGKIEMLSNNVMPIYEPGLEELVRRNVRVSRLSFSSNIPVSVTKADIVFIAVGTPQGIDGVADLSALRRAARTVGENINRSTIIVNKSTSPIGTADEIDRIVNNPNRHRNIRCEIVSNPEFLREGSAIYDSLHPDRIVIGSSSQRAANQIIRLYAPLKAPVVVTDSRSAEMIKYASNAFLATKISYINAIANLCELTGADIAKVSEGMGYDKRIGPDFLKAGLGYGGSCFGKDTQCLISMSKMMGYDFDLLKAVVDVNSEQPTRFVRKIIHEIGAVRDKKIAVLGLAFKPGTDDLRDAKSLDIIAQLLNEEAHVRAYDPIAMNKARKIYPQIEYCRNPYEALAGSDAAVVVTEWDEFSKLDLRHVFKLMANPLIFDGRNIFDPEKMMRLGFHYHSIGRAEKRPVAVPAQTELLPIMQVDEQTQA